MIILKKLKWDNCFSYGAGNELNLDSNTLTQVLGTNGVGKSSIPLILEEALFNKNSKNVKKSDIPNRNIGSGYSIYLDFTKDSDVYEIQLERKTNIKVKLIKNGEDISSHTATNTYKTIQEIIGIDFKTFSQIVYQNTNASLQFLTATDTNRKKFLIELLNLDDYMKFFEVFKVAAKEVSEENIQLQSQFDTVQKWLDNNKVTSTKVLPLLELPNLNDEDEEELRSLLVEIKNISQNNREISKNNEYKKLLNYINITTLRGSKYKELQSYDKEQAELGSVRSEIYRLSGSINKMKSLGDECHTCGQPIDSSFKTSLIDKDKADWEALSSIEAKILNDILVIQTHNKETTKVLAGIREWEDLYRAIDNTMGSELLDEEALLKDAKVLQQAIKERKSELDQIITENTKRNSHNTRIQVVREQSQEFEAQLETVSKKLDKTKGLLNNLEILKKSFSTNGLVAYKIENLVEELEDLTSQYLSELSDGRFTLEFVISNDKLNVQVTDNGVPIDILALSSGELARVTTATLLAIRKLMSSISSSQINVLFLDEVINVLDELGKEKLVEVLLQEDELNTFVVSHQWEHPLLSKLHITKNNNVSSIEID